MPEWLIGLFCIVSGVTAVGTGVLMTAHRVQRIRRVRTKQAGALSTQPDGWGLWFAQGFADMTTGTNLMFASALLLAWVLLGAWLTGLGLRLAL